MEESNISRHSKIYFRNRIMRLRIADNITENQYKHLKLLSDSSLDEDFILAEQMLRIFIITE